ncbi:MAG: Flp pilus assembly complex ATPase component [Candidatus Diapherotrites archaeon]|nr:Flp pilus assembly complex ATPase component [Candidatus Diapherotrites archaeon]
MKLKHEEQAFQEAMARNPHLRKYVEELIRKWKKPIYVTEIPLDLKVAIMDEINVIYPVGEPYFVHIRKKHGEDPMYIAIQPEYSKEDLEYFRKLYEKITRRVSLMETVPKTQDEFINLLIELTEKIVYTRRDWLWPFYEWILGKVYIPEERKRVIRELLIRELAQYSMIEVFMRDPYIEDISCVGTHPIWIVHKIFGSMETNVAFKDEEELEDFIFRLTELLNRPATEVRPIVDAAMPDGSRLNVIYSKDISIRGSSFTIRKFTKVPISITQLIKWNTLSAEEAAYFWLAIQAGSSVFICGETAAGKTTTLKALTTFIEPRARIFSVEDTPEIYVPHKNWVRTITAEGKADMFDLLKAALRARPDYIIVGEIRGAEGYVAFQAMQTGHPVMSTFHAGSVNSFIRRISGPPINVPKEYIPNVQIVAIQQSVMREGKKYRRMISISEIERYHPPTGSIVTRESFAWDPVTDTHQFKAWYNSYVLEEIVAPTLGMSKEEVYHELKVRAAVLQEMVNRGFFDYFKVYELVSRYIEFGLEGLPFTVVVE